MIKAIESGNTSLGIEFGSTRIKLSLIDDDCTPIASGSFTWENSLVEGVWTYSLDLVKEGMKSAYRDLKADVKKKYGVILKKVGAIGISAMMHGYLAFDNKGNLLVPFRTWRNTMTAGAQYTLSSIFSFNIPERWSVAHLAQAIMNGEQHVKDIDNFTTLAGYVHRLLTGVNALGIGDASGMFPIDSTTLTYNAEMVKKFNDWAGDYEFNKDILDLLPPVMVAGKECGRLTEDGAKLLDEDGDLESGIPFCPPEGDAGTGMVATGAVTPLSGNVSAGTSVFAMIVLEKPLKGYYNEIDVVTTPSGKDVAMVHCNNCSSDIDAWVKVFKEVGESFGSTITMDEAYSVLLKKALQGKKDCDGIVSLNYLSGESITYLPEGKPMMMREATSNLNLPNVMRSLLYSAFATLRIGMDILYNVEGVKVNSIAGHGGYFKAKEVGGIMASSALKTTITVTQTAGEGGPWGMAILAKYLKDGAPMPLEDYLLKQVFASSQIETFTASEEDVKGFEKYMENYLNLLEAERRVVLGEEDDDDCTPCFIRVNS